MHSSSELIYLTLQKYILAYFMFTPVYLLEENIPGEIYESAISFK